MASSSSPSSARSWSTSAAIRPKSPGLARQTASEQSPDCFLSAHPGVRAAMIEGDETGIRGLAVRQADTSYWRGGNSDRDEYQKGAALMKVKMILPALTEALSPYFRPIKYSLFPPLGLATLAGYL